MSSQHGVTCIQGRKYLVFVTNAVGYVEVVINIVSQAIKQNICHIHIVILRSYDMASKVLTFGRAHF